MNLQRSLVLLFILTALICFGVTSASSQQTNTDTSATALSTKTKQIADFTLKTYKLAAKNALAEMVAIETVNYPGEPLLSNPAFNEFRAWIKQKAERLGLEFTDHDSVLIISTGEGEKKLGLITHGDVQPANPAKWQQSPFSLDDTSEPGKWIGRGTEDDKGPIAAALYAMKSLNDQNITLSGRVELIIYLAEESDWAPLQKFLESYQPAPINIALDSEYPVVTAEKAWSSVTINFGLNDNLLASSDDTRPLLVSFKGGSFRSQIPEDAVAVCQQLSETEINILEKKLAELEADFSIKSTVTSLNGRHIISVQGLSAHSSKPEQGVNAINFLALALAEINWQNSPSSNMVYLISDLVGTGFKAEKFGHLGYQDEFMGPLTLSPTLISKSEKHEWELFINLRRPAGKTKQQVKDDINQALMDWQKQRGITVSHTNYIGEPYLMNHAPQTPKLIDIFAAFTGEKDPKPIAIGGSTNAKLFPQAVSFGPSMPGQPYSGHSEKEFITEQAFAVTLQMYAAMLYELAATH